MERQAVEHLSDRELLMILNDRSERIEAAVLGNGQPGLVTRVAQLEGAGSKQAAKNGGLSALVAVAVAVVMHRLGIGG